MIHDNIFAQASCDVTRECDEEVFTAIFGDPFIHKEGTRPCSTCGRDVCMVCGRHTHGNGECPMPMVAKIMES